MKRIGFLALAAMVLTACSSDNEELRINSEESTEVTLTFSPYDVSPMTRTATSIAEVVNHLDVWITDGMTEVSAHQTNTDDGFGTIILTLDKTKTYMLYAVAHKADGATLNDGVISFTNDKVTHSMFYSTTFTPATTTSLSCLMNRIVADFRLDITDDVPSAVKKLRFTVSGVYDRWHVADGGTHQLDRTSTINYPANATPVFNIYAITTDAQTAHTVTVEALDANDGVVQTRTFFDVPLRNGYRTTYRGTFFTDATFSSSFTVENDWNEYDTVDF